MTYDEVKYWNERPLGDGWAKSDIHDKQIEFTKRQFVRSNLGILDFGAGSGRMFEAFGKAIFVEAYDVSALRREQLERQAEKYDFDTHITIEESMKPLNYPDNFFDYAIAAEVLLHQSHEHIIRVMSELVRVSKKVIAFTWYEPDKKFENLSTGEKGFRYGSATHCFHYDYPKICRDNNWQYEFEIYGKQIFLTFWK